MIFSIVDMDKMHRNFMVADGAGNTMKVTGYQIVSVLASGSSCTNAKLIKDGFVINANGNLIEIKPQLDDALRKIVNKLVRVENEARKARIVHAQVAQQVQQVDKPQPRARVKATVKPKIDSSIAKEASNQKQQVKAEKIYYQGTLYYSEADICKRNGCNDIERFKELYAKGYPIAVCLGKEPIDTNAPAPKPRYKQVDSMFSNKESEWYSSEITEK